MAETQKYRDYIKRRVEAVKKNKETLKEAEKCKHEWKTFRQSVPIQEINYKPSDAYFIVQGCHKCKSKHLIDFKTS